MKCRICASSNARAIGSVEYYASLVCDVYECCDCLCRFAKHDDTIHEYLHSSPNSPYGSYREIQDQCRRLFANGDVDGLRNELCRTPKYDFVIQAAKQKPRESRLLEIGCAKGHLTAYFILAGFDVTGTDVSTQAIGEANRAFGDHFVPADSPAIQERAPYDLIYHVGTIGCVNNPIEFTRNLLMMLKPGGQLLFNAPNADSCSLRGQLWIDAAPPPDLVTLFRPGFWQRFFGDIADVSEQVEPLPADRACAIGLRRLVGRKWRAPIPQQLEGSLDDFKRTRPENGGFWTKAWNLFERSVVKAGRLTGTLRLLPSQPNPFGLFVTMTKK